MITRILAIASLLLFGFFASAAQGATAISYSEADNTYGWCAGYSTSEAPGCAKRLCEESNGQDCKLALVCDAGWNAVAFADSDEAVGFGSSCDMGSAYNARLSALASCIAASKTLCWTNSTFNGGGDERSDNDNGEFDLTWYVQGLLKGLNYDPGSTDGEFGNRTRTAIRAFQADMGLEQTGEVSEDLVYILLGKNGGVVYLVSAMEQLVADFSADEKSRVYAASYTPLQSPTLSDELSFRNTAVQRILLADYLRFNDRDCPVPATRTDRTDPANGVWTITCSNGGSYTVTLSADGKSDTIADNNAQPAPTEEPETEVAENTDPEPSANQEIGPGIAFSHAGVNDYASYCIGAEAAASECAQNYCVENSGGESCEIVLTCADRSWSAAAVSPGAVRGMGFACGYQQAYGAREVALAECLYRSRAVCSLAMTIDPDGNAQPDDEDALFTRVYNAQVMLSMLQRFDAILSGKEDDVTREAVMGFQRDIGIEPTGVVDDELLTLLSYAVTGQKAFVFVIERDIYNTIDPATADYHAGASDRPFVEIGYDEELRGLSEAERLRALAVSVSMVEGFHCTIPALGATANGDSGWIVDCAEGTFEVNLSGFITTVNEVGDATDTQPATPAPGKDKGGPLPKGKDKG